MAQSRNSRYQYGTAAYKMDVRREMERPYESQEQYKPGRVQRRAPRFNLMGMLFVMTALLFCVGMMMNYIKLQSTLTSKVKTVAAKQVELNELQSMNDETYSQILRSVDLAEIESVARGELGMTYAQEGQIVKYSSAGNDYMRKVDNGK